MTVIEEKGDEPKEDKGNAGAIPSPFMPTAPKEPTPAEAMSIPGTSLDPAKLEQCRKLIGADCVMFLVQMKRPDVVGPNTMQKVEIVSIGFDEQFAQNLMRMMSIIPAPLPKKDDPTIKP